MDVLQKVRALLALATSNNIDEARNAALAAVRLISEHKIVLTLPAPALGVTFPAPTFRVRVPSSKPTRRASLETEGEWKKIKAKFEGSCKWCRKKIAKNTSIYWSPDDSSAYHVVCYLNSGVT